MKKFLSILLLLAVCMTGCNEERVENMNSMQEKEAVVNIKEESLSNTGLVLVVKNETDDCAFEFGNAYSLEMLVDGNWIDVKQLQDVPITAIAHMVLPGESIEHAVNWERRYGSLPTGDYRLVKRVERVHEDGEGFNNVVGDYYIYVSFSV